MSKFTLCCFVIFIFLTDALAQVDTAWVRYYGNGSSDDGAQAIVVDNNGNVYVTGSGWNGTSYDYATIKYGPGGDTLWSRLYNGPSDFSDVATAICLDGSGNVIVTGFSYGGINVDFDYATVKYSSAGDELWVRRYNGPGNFEDKAASIATDSAGNIYVTGSSYFGDGLNIDYATLKYSSGGDSLWLHRFDGPGHDEDMASALVVDHNNNVIVTGHQYNGVDFDFATIKYTTTGDTLWVRTYSGPENADDAAKTLTVDNAGNVYVTGYVYDNGIQYATIKYSPAGDSLWVREYNGPGDFEDEPMGIAVDKSGNVYVTGHSDGGITDFDYATLKYAADGTLLWTQRYNGTGNSQDYATALAVDTSGNVYVTGYSYNIDGNFDYTTIKYADDGHVIWSTSFNGPGDFIDMVVGMALDNSGQVYLTGSTGWSTGGTEYATLKYIQIPLSVQEHPGEHPQKFVLEQNYPNPFNPSTSIRYGLPSRSRVKLEIFDLLGRKVAYYDLGIQEAGFYLQPWHAFNESSGIYFYRLVATSANYPSKNFTQVRKMLLLR